MRTRLTTLLSLAAAPLALMALFACSGSHAVQEGSQATTVMDSQDAQTFSASFLDLENNQAGEMDDSGPIVAGEATAMRQPDKPACVTASDVTPNSVTWTFNACAGPHGWVWNGVTVISWARNTDGSVLVKHDRRNMVGTHEGKTITVNGIKDHLINPTTKTVQITAEPGFTKVLNNGTTTVSYAYTCNLTANRAEEGKRKLSGSWAMTPTTGDAIGGSISAATPLVWDKAANCCHPVSGTLSLTRGTKNATLTFGLPCGSITVNGTAKTLGACAS